MDIAAQSREQLQQQHPRRFGTANPQRMHVPLWKWMVRTGLSAYAARSELGLDQDALQPGWCFNRFGMSRTTLPDGRILCIAGEHEDHYDPDFCIYNDLIVLRPEPRLKCVMRSSGHVEIYGYPEAVFPPTDFHSATLVGDRIYLIGRLGYWGKRSAGTTPVMALDTSSYRIGPIQPGGPCPGWIYRHHAAYDAALHAITVRGGMIDVPGARHETPNLAAHRLHLADLRWEVLCPREMHRRFILRQGEGGNWNELEEDAFHPRGIAFDWLPPEDRGAMVYQISVEAVRITFEDYSVEVRVLVEGNLPEATIQAVLANVIANLERTTETRWNVEEVEGFE